MKILIIHKNKQCKLQQQLEKVFQKEEITFVWKNKLEKSQFKNINFAITIGGDGTFLSASHFIENQPIIGVNSNMPKSEGALTSTEIKKIKRKIKQILERKCRVKKYYRENITIFKKDKTIKTEPALNDTFIGNINPHHPSNYLLKFKNKIEKQQSSGILVSTGTGSTAWYKSMGGRPFNKTSKSLKFKIREPYSRRIHKTKIKKGKIKPYEKLTIISKMNYGILAIDSIRTYPLEFEDKIEISLGKPLNVIQ